MGSADKNYRFLYHEIFPTEEISHLVSYFFEFVIEGTSKDPIPHEVLPDGCISLLFRKNERLGIKMLLLKGLSLETFYTEVFSGDILWGAKFAPAACENIMRCDPKKIPTQPLYDNKLLPHLTSGLTKKLEKSRSLYDFISELGKVLVDLKVTKDEIDQKIANSVNLIQELCGEAKISEIAKRINLSTRQFERRFRKNSGITPKQFSRICRLRATAIHMIETDMNWANRAAEMGFTDQAHLTHELSSLTGHSPKSFEKMIKDIEHEDIIK